jgi:hypothetical protein
MLFHLQEIECEGFKPADLIAFKIEKRLVAQLKLDLTAQAPPRKWDMPHWAIARTGHAPSAWNAKASGPRASVRLSNASHIS